LLSAPVSRWSLAAASFAATAAELATVLALAVLLTAIGSLLSGADLAFDSAVTGFASVWFLALLGREKRCRGSRFGPREGGKKSS
jgi:hypothetical protein